MHIRITQDSFEENVRWLEVSHNGSAWSTVRIQNDDEALQIANALQQSVQADLATDCPNCGDKLFCAMCGEGVLLAPPSQ